MMWRVRTIASNGASYLQISEIQFRSTANGGNVAVSGYAFDSGGNNAVNCFDSTDAFWSTNAGAVKGQFVAYHFSSPVNVVEVAITPGPDLTAAPQDFVLEFSEDGLRWNRALLVHGFVSWVAGAASVFSVASTDAVATSDLINDLGFISAVPNTAVVPGIYKAPTLTVDSSGRITSAINGGNFLTLNPAPSDGAASDGATSVSPSGYVVPHAADFSTSVKSLPTSELIDVANGLLLRAKPTGSNVVSAYFKPLPSGDWSVAAKILCGFNDDAYQGIGISVRLADTSQQLVTILHQTRGGGTPFIAGVLMANDGSSFGSDLARRPNSFNCPYLRLTYTSATQNMVYEGSLDGVTWTFYGDYTFTSAPGSIGPTVFSNYSYDSRYYVQGTFTGWNQSW
jgi:hypothetical protein